VPRGSRRSAERDTREGGAPSGGTASASPAPVAATSTKPGVAGRPAPPDRVAAGAAPADGLSALAAPAEGPSALAATAARLRCPHCRAALALALQGRVLCCSDGHRYDVARRGHVSLLPPRARALTGDSREMVAARDAFLGAGHYARIATAVSLAAHDAVAPDAMAPDAVAPAAAVAPDALAHDGVVSHEGGVGCVVDLGAGTGYHLAAALERLPGWWGLALDASRPALQRAMRMHPRIAAVACDVWSPLPIRNAAVDLALNVFAPRNGSEIARVLSPRGALVVVTPTAQHLRQLVAAMGMLEVGAAKQVRLHAVLAPHLRPVRRRTLEFDLVLDRGDVRALVAMGPSAHHVATYDLDRRLSLLPEAVTVTASVVVETFRRA